MGASTAPIAIAIPFLAHNTTAAAAAAALPPRRCHPLLLLLQVVRWQPRVLAMNEEALQDKVKLCRLHACLITVLGFAHTCS